MWLTKRFKLWTSNNNSSEQQDVICSYGQCDETMWHSSTREVLSHSLQSQMKEFYHQKSSSSSLSNNNNNNTSTSTTTTSTSTNTSPFHSPRSPPMSPKSSSALSSTSTSTSSSSFANSLTSVSSLLASSSSSSSQDHHHQHQNKKNLRVNFELSSPLDGISFVEIRNLSISSPSLSILDHHNSGSDGRFFKIKTSDEKVKTSINNHQVGHVDHWDQDHYLIKIDPRENLYASSSSSSSPPLPSSSVSSSKRSVENPNETGSATLMNHHASVNKGNSSSSGGGGGGDNANGGVDLLNDAMMMNNYRPRSSSSSSLTPSKSTSALSALEMSRIRSVSNVNFNGTAIRGHNGHAHNGTGSCINGGANGGNGNIALRRNMSAPDVIPNGRQRSPSNSSLIHHQQQQQVHATTRYPLPKGWLEFELWNHHGRKRNRHVGSAFVDVSFLPRNKYVLICEPVFLVKDDVQSPTSPHFMSTSKFYNDTTSGSGGSGGGGGGGDYVIFSCLLKAHHFGQKSCLFSKIEQSNYRKMISYHLRFESLYSKLAPQVFAHLKRPKNMAVCDDERDKVKYDFLKQKLVKFVHDQELVDRMALSLSNVDSVYELLTSAQWTRQLRLKEKRENDGHKSLQDTSESSPPSQSKSQFDAVAIKVAIGHALVDDHVQKVCRRYAATPTQAILNVSGACEVQTFYCALIVGPFLLYWNSDGICVPRSIFSTDILLTHEVATVQYRDELDHVLRSCAQEIVQWNGSYSFSELSCDDASRRRGNSFTFMNSLLKRLGHELKNETATEKFIHSMSMCGSGQMRFTMSKEFKDCFKFDFDSIVFDQHRSLDRFVRELFTVDPNWETTWSEESLLLHAYDKFFWVQFSRANSLLERMEQLVEITSGKQTSSDRSRRTSLDLHREIARMTKKLDDLEPNNGQCPMNPELTGHN